MRTFSEIRAVIEELEGTTVDAELARRVGVSPQTWNGWDKRGTVSEKFLLPYCRRRGVSWEWLRTGEGPRDVPQPALHDDAFADVPLMATKASAGGGLVAEEGVQALYKFRREWLSRVGPLGSLCLVRIKGDSMEPTLRDGDLVMIDRSRRDVGSGVRLIRERDKVSVKRVKASGQKGLLLVESDNPVHGSRVVNVRADGFEVLGRVVWLGRTMVE